MKMSCVDMVGLLFSRGRKSPFLAVIKTSSRCDRSGRVGVVWVWAGLDFGHRCCCGVWWEWAQLNAWSVPSWSLVGWAGGLKGCPSATVHHPAGGRSYLGWWCSSCQSYRLFILQFPPDHKAGLCTKFTVITQVSVTCCPHPHSILVWL